MHKKLVMFKRGIIWVCGCVCVHVSGCACVSVCVLACACVSGCVYGGGWVYVCACALWVHVCVGRCIAVWGVVYECVGVDLWVCTEARGLHLVSSSTTSPSSFLSQGPSLNLEFFTLAVTKASPSEPSLQPPTVEPFWKEQNCTILSHSIITH